MKVLATTDFSETSINAIKWGLDVMKSVGSCEMEIIHCIEYNNRADVFLRVDEWLQEQADKDMKIMEEKLAANYSDVPFSTSVHRASSKSFIPAYAKKHGFDFILTGTTGLSKLKEITIGSVTEYIATHSEVPLLAVPQGCTYKGFQDIVVAFEGSDKDAQVHWDSVRHMSGGYEPAIHLAHVRNDHRELELTPEMKEALKGLKYDIKYVDFRHSVAFSLNEFATSVNADLMVFAHERRNWFGRMFTKSVTKSELFSLQTALLILPK